MFNKKRRGNQKNHETEEVEIEIEHIQDNDGFYDIFLKEQIIDSFKSELINRSRLEPFVVDVKKSSFKDQNILKLWEVSFQGFLFGKKTNHITPYIITENLKTNIKTLWIEGK